MNILIVDDDQTNLVLFSLLLESIPDVWIVAISDPVAALEWCERHTADLLLLDYRMPGMDGMHFLAEFRKRTIGDPIPVIMITADAQIEVRHQALQLSANDFMTKPISKVELRVRVTNMLELRRLHTRLCGRINDLELQSCASKAEVNYCMSEMTSRLSRAAQCRDPETGAHLIRMARYAGIIAEHLGMSEQEQQMIREGAPLHDIGKVGIPDAILLKKGRLSDEEMAVMRTHPQLGADILKGSESPQMQIAAAIALSHHEKYDGSGYPYGLVGDAIPLCGRIVAVADVFDALTSCRPYKAAWETSAAAEFLADGSGKHFDPECVTALLKGWDQVLVVHDEFNEARCDASIH
jgi:response regulator RpfG family c-di-GMP phosphodiesterase